MNKIIKELKLLINKEIDNKKIISFEEFKLMNEKIMEIENGYNKC